MDSHSTIRKVEWEYVVHEKSVRKFKEKLKGITGRSNAMSIYQRMLKLKAAITGWVNYFGIADMTRHVRVLDKWLRRRLRMCFWKQWKRIKTRHDNLVRRGLDRSKAWEYANTRKGYWRTSNSPILARTITSAYLEGLGLQSIARRYSLYINLIEPPYTERYVRWCERTAGELITCLLLAF